MNEITHKEIWETLSKINVNQYVEDKYGLTFLPWVYSWHLLQEHFPEAQYDFDPNEIHADGSVTVHCTVSIASCCRSMHLPVMDNKMKSLIQPSSRDISDAKQRCLVKCIGMHGLGIYLWTGHGSPLSETTAKSVDEPKAEPESTPEPEPGPSTPAKKDTEDVILDALVIKNDEGAEQVTKLMLEMATKFSKTESQLKKFWTSNKATTDLLEKDWSQHYEVLLAGFKKMKQNFSADEITEGDEGYLPNSQQAADHWAEVTVKFIEKHCDDTNGLDALWETDKETIAHVENNYAPAYEILKAGFKSRYAALAKEKTDD